jgi:hypothetical protein
VLFYLSVDALMVVLMVFSVIIMAFMEEGTFATSTSNSGLIGLNPRFFKIFLQLVDSIKSQNKTDESGIMTIGI